MHHTYSRIADMQYAHFNKRLQLFLNICSAFLAEFCAEFKNEQNEELSNENNSMLSCKIHECL